MAQLPQHQERPGAGLIESNAGGRRDNAKKYIEQGSSWPSGSEAHEAAVGTRYQGDPFKGYLRLP